MIFEKICIPVLQIQNKRSAGKSQEFSLEIYRKIWEFRCIIKGIKERVFVIGEEDEIILRVCKKNSDQRQAVLADCMDKMGGGVSDGFSFISKHWFFFYGCRSNLQKMER